MYETGQRGAEILRRILEEGASPVSSFVRLPIVLPPERANTQATPEEVAAGSYSDWPPRFLAQAQGEIFAEGCDHRHVVGPTQQRPPHILLITLLKRVLLVILQ